MWTTGFFLFQNNDEMFRMATSRVSRGSQGSKRNSKFNFLMYQKHAYVELDRQS